MVIDFLMNCTYVGAGLGIGAALCGGGLGLARFFYYVAPGLAGAVTARLGAGAAVQVGGGDAPAGTVDDMWGDAPFPVYLLNTVSKKKDGKINRSELCRAAGIPNGGSQYSKVQQWLDERGL